MSDLSKVMPQNLEAEQRALGAMLIDDDAVMRTTDIIRPEDFYAEKHIRIYNAILDCYQLEGKTDTVTVMERLRQKEEIESIGGATYLSYLFNVAVSASNVKRDALRIAEKALYRRVIHWTTELEGQAYIGVENMREWFAQIQFEFLSLASAVREKKSPRITDVLFDLETQWREFKTAKEKKYSAVTGKYCEVNLLKPFNAESPIPYFMPGHLWMIGGYTSAGKSTTLAQLLCDVCLHGAKILVFSLEESRTTKAVKMIANITDIPQRYLLTGELSDHDKTLVERAREKMRKWNPIIYDDVRTLDEICLKTKKHVMQDGINILAVDYVQNIIGDGNSIYNDMRLVGPTLLDLSIELGITTIALSQVTNESMRDDSQIIGLKGAGELAAAADIVLWLKRVKNNPLWLDGEIKKNRPFGQTGIVPMTFSDRYTRVSRRST